MPSRRSYGQRMRRARERAAHREWLSRPENASERYKIYTVLAILAVALGVAGMLTFLGFKTR
jgi:hypothetical protein